MIPSFLLKTTELELDFIFKNTHYKIKGISKNKNNKLHINFGNYGDEFPCIMLEYDIKKRIFIVSKLRAVAFGGYNEDDRVVCLKPNLPEKGALDILVMLSLSIADYIDKGCIVTIRDDAKIDNNYPLSWRKYFTKGETTYSKYGFVLRDPEDTFETFQEDLDILEMLLQDKVSDNLSKSSIQKIYKEVNSINKRFKEKKKSLIQFSENEILEKFLKDILESRKYDKIMDVLEDELGIELRGTWYLSWEYYDLFISESLKVHDLHMKSI
jgi:hypothetical protein